jgi:hypothetical protein
MMGWQSYIRDREMTQPRTRVFLHIEGKDEEQVKRA